MFYLAGIVLTFFLAILLITKKGKSAADRILVVWIVAIGLHLFFFFLEFTDKIYEFPHLLGLQIPLPLVHGPLLFLYTGAVTNRIVCLKYNPLHFIPVLLTYCIFIPFFLLSPEQRVLVYQNEGHGFENQLLVLQGLTMISGVVYVVLSLWLLRKHRMTIKDQFSTEDKINLVWLRYLIYGISIIWIFVLFGNDPMIFNSVVVFVFFLGYFGIKQVGIFVQQPEKQIGSGMKLTDATPQPDGVDISASQANKNTLQGEPGKEKYLSSSLSKTDAVEIHEKLSALIVDKKLFINPELTLAGLAKALDVHPNNLSQVINTFIGKSFYDYVNHLRVAEFKRIAALPESKKFTLLALAHDCGFNSKTSFNRNFKRATGLSPTEYLTQSNILVESIG